MKAIIHLCLMAIFSIAVSSCSKTDLTNSIGNNNIPNTTPVIDARIYHFVNQPFETELGTPAAVFHEGDNVTIYIPYVVVNDNLQSATISMIDDATGLEIGKYDLVPSTDPSAAQLNIPDAVRLVPFMFVTFTTDNNYTDKTISLTTSFAGLLTSTTDAVNSAFTVVL